MMTRRCICLFIIMVTFPAVPCAHAYPEPAPLSFTDAEKNWIELHPTLRVAVLDNLSPIEYVEKGELKGLSAEYLQLIARRSGMKISHIAAHSIKDRLELLMSGRADLVSTVRLNGPTGGDPRLLHSTPYLNTTTVIITRTGSPPLFEAEQLDGLTVTLPYFDRYSEYLAEKAPRAKLIIGGSALTMLQQVAEGTADVAVASEAYLLPFLYRQFQGQLQISGVLTNMASLIGMSTRRDEPELHSIIQKILDSVTAEDVRELHADWLSEHATQSLALSDITEHYPHEVALAGLALLLLLGMIFLTRRSRQRAERNEQEKAMFLAVMSHEIRSPMNAVVAAIELLGNTPLDKQQQHFADLANNGARSLLQLLNDVLDVSKLEAGKLTLEPEPVNIYRLINDVVDLHRSRAREKHLSISVGGDPLPPLLMLDSPRLGQVLHNLLSNAIKFTEVGGMEVAYSVSPLDNPRRQHLQITVTDTGIGMSAESQARLFQPYSQAAQSYKRSGGTGLGLVICRDILRLMGGTLMLDSALGEGSRFELSLAANLAPPTAAETERVPDETHVPAVAVTTNLRVLVVEDTVANQAVLKAQIEGFGCTPVIARNGSEAIDCFEHGTFDIILMDCDLPDQDGYTVTRLLRMIEQDIGQARCPIVAISASTDNQHIARCFDAGMDGVLSKPISLGKLQDVIELWCGVTLKLLPQPFTENKGAVDVRIVEAFEHDLLALLESITLQRMEDAKYAAHRLYGAALSIEWLPVADLAGSLEQMLKAKTPLHDNQYAIKLQALIEAFRSPVCEHSLQAQSRAP